MKTKVKGKPSLDELMRSAANQNGCTTREMRSKCKDFNVVRAREFFTAACRVYGYRMYVVAWSLKRAATATTYYTNCWEANMVIPSYNQEYYNYLNRFPVL